MTKSCPNCGCEEIYFDTKAYLQGGSVVAPWFDCDIRVVLELLEQNEILHCDNGHSFFAREIQEISGEERPSPISFWSTNTSSGSY